LLFEFSCIAIAKEGNSNDEELKKMKNICVIWELVLALEYSPRVRVFSIEKTEHYTSPENPEKI